MNKEQVPPPCSPSQRLTREQTAWYALETLEREQFVAFIRAIRNDTHCIAVSLANKAFDEGRTVDQLFFTGEQYGFQLHVVPGRQYEHTPGQHPHVREIQTLEIEFGCVAGGLAGDGGQWIVALTPEGTFDRVLSQRGGWIA